ncbi:SDR family NAD(P)-dependent oxidoreductase [Kibdelosporangium aridum]|uniref:SDR family NAD(P)-dependent oxidoreductase n=1 Tax=Kibdelosporangium aridum TaxID=2030 RepID=A0A428ZQX6_KIBAR|nr:SDR family oxidoreductase [Kibdelosporangium aridum]RSM90468.1 SDR family NAD(P)-dependent oxidoreductase [Kibdelosporangium aridum]
MSISAVTTSSTQIALITGGNRGIGRATALELARRGIDVILTYRSHAEEAEAVVASIIDLGRTSVALPLDVGATGSFAQFASAVAEALRGTWGRESFDFLINNAGTQRPGSFADATEDDFDSLVNVAFKGVFFLTQKLVPLMADNGAIVNISSGMTRFYVPQRVVYSAVKGAVEVLTRYLAQELGPRGIRVNTIAPGSVATDFSGGLLRDNEQVQKAVVSVTAMGRFAEPDDISGAVATLLENGNRWVTGQRIEVSGGVHL